MADAVTNAAQRILCVCQLSHRRYVLGKFMNERVTFATERHSTRTLSIVGSLILQFPSAHYAKHVSKHLCSNMGMNKHTNGAMFRTATERLCYEPTCRVCKQNMLSE